MLIVIRIEDPWLAGAGACARGVAEPRGFISSVTYFCLRRGQLGLPWGGMAALEGSRGRGLCWPCYIPSTSVSFHSSVLSLDSLWPLCSFVFRSQSWGKGNSFGSAECRWKCVCCGDVTGAVASSWHSPGVHFTHLCLLSLQYKGNEDGETVIIEKDHFMDDFFQQVKSQFSPWIKDVFSLCLLISVLRFNNSSPHPPQYGL